MTTNEPGTTLDQLVAAGQWPAVLHFCQSALACAPRRADYWNLLGVCHRHLGQDARALAAYQRALAEFPAFGAAWQNLGNLYRQQGRFPDALTAYQNALAAETTPATLDAQGETLHHMGRLQDALPFFDRALQLAPNFADARWDRALTRLHAEDWVGGFSDYEARWDRNQPPRPQLPFPEWDGSAVKTLFIHTEQGFGDTIQFMRFLRLVLPLADQVILAVMPTLQSLIAPHPQLQLTQRGIVPETADAHCSLMSLPFLLKLPQSAMPGEPWGITASADGVQAWRDRLGASARKRIGLVWCGNPNLKNDWLRSPGLEQTLALIDACPTTDFVILQQGAGRNQLANVAPRANLVDPGVLTDFGDTAGLMGALDGVVSSDTSTAHLAGALGCPLGVMVPHVADWRWGLTGRQSSWYPSARVYRQPTFFDWPGLMQDLAADINTGAWA